MVNKQWANVNRQWAIVNKQNSKEVKALDLKILNIQS
jgi:hypothetical protein